MTDQNKDREKARKAYMSAEAATVRRRTDEQYGRPAIHFPEWMLSKRKHWRGDESVLDLSPSTDVVETLIAQRAPQGHYLSADIEPAMLEDAPPDAFQLDFEDDSVDVVIADHILYHINHLDNALQEIQRVMRPSGVLLASTHSQYTMGEFDTLTRRALTLLGRPPRSNDIYYGRFVEPFALENGAVQLARCFRAVARFEVPSTLVFDEARPVIDFLNSNRVALELTLPEDIQWDDYIAIMHEQIRRLISHFGELVVNRLAGVLLATQEGDFAATYFNILDDEG
jgi:SAM-dependent methyltransferase